MRQAEEVRQAEDDICKRFDTYVKKTFLNDLCMKSREKERKNNYNISFVPLPNDDLSVFHLEITEKEFENIELQRLNIDCYDIYVSNEELAYAINALPYKNRVTLLLNVVEDIPMKDIALQLEVGDRMAKKYKRVAIEEIRRILTENAY